MEIVISDANILIDIEKADLTDDFFKLPYSMHTTDFIIHELRDTTIIDKMHYLEAQGKLTIKQFTSDELAAIIAIQTDQPQLSIQDCSVWKYAKDLKGRLLTGDRKLRKCAEDDSILVSGILFILDEMVESFHIISCSRAAEALRKLISMNPRLPAEECGLRISRWENQDNN